VISKYGDGRADGTLDEDPGHVVFVEIGRVLYFTFIIPIIILLYISRSVAEDREYRTITYFLSRPISKPSILMSKYISALIAALIMVIPSMIVAYFITSGYKDGMDVAFDNIIILKTFIGVTILGLLVYSAIFTLYAALFKHPLIIGLIYSFFFDQLISYLNFKINRIGIGYYLVDIAASNLKKYNAIEIYEPIDPWVAGAILCVTTVILIFVSVIFYTEKDFH
jgi:ABC-2 type transport system permease protein